MGRRIMNRIHAVNRERINLIAVTFTLTLIYALLKASPVWAADNWKVEALHGDVSRYEQGIDTWVAVAPDSELVVPFTIRTGVGATVKLQRDGDQVSLMAETILEFPAETINNKSVLTRVLQKIGFALFRVEPGKARTVTVETPYLVSVVKGTTFSVHATENRGVVNLISGQLEVNAVIGNDTVIIQGGQIALLASGSKKITVISPAQPVDNEDAGGDMSLGPVDVVVGDMAASADILTPRVVELPTVPDVSVPDVPDVPDTPDDACTTGGQSCTKGRGDLK